MKAAKTRVLWAFVGLLILSVVGYSLWKPGTPYGDRLWSPNHRFYVQKFENLGWERFTGAMPGQGSDRVSGFVRLFTANGQLLGERFVRFSRDVEPVWSGDKVYLLGSPDSERSPWVLPGSAD